MSVPRLKAGGDSGSAGSERPTWFQDVKTGCEKQTDYFLRIRKLQKELINREQHNLVNAMERLKQIQYPRRKPFVRNFEGPPSGSKCFPIRPSNTRRNPKHRLHQRPEFDELKPLKGKVMLPSKTQVDDEANMEPFTLDEIKRIYSMLPILNDKQIAKIIHDVRTTFPNEPSTYLLQPHLPSIPSVPRKASRRLDNRLKLLTLTESSCSVGSSNSFTHLRSTSSHHKKTDGASKDETEKKKQNKEERRKGKKNILAFDVDPNDSSVFSNCQSPHRVAINDDPSPSPPPNSRPTSHVQNKEELQSDPSEAVRDSNKNLTESENAVENAVEISASNKLDEKIQEKTLNLTESNLDERNNSKEILDEEKKADEHLQQEEQQEEMVHAVERVESIEDLSENKSENASVIYIEPIVKITKKANAAVQNE